MDKKLLQKYFRNQCSIEEIEQVLNWFRTKEGQRYFEENLDRDMKRYSESDRLLLYPDVPTDKMLQDIRRSKSKKNHKENQQNFWKTRIAAAIVIFVTLAAVAAITFQTQSGSTPPSPEITTRTISTQEDQHRVISLNDGTRIRLNSNSSIEVPEQFSEDQREISLSGEAWFNVAKDETKPFHVRAGKVAIQVLGTEFNVKAHPSSRNVQVAVAEGRVSLNTKTRANGTAAILTKNTFAEFDLDNDEILIEHTPVENYMSWISGRLYFYDEPLWVVSRYIERLYGVAFQFEHKDLKELSLSTNMTRDELTSVLDIIAQTLGIGYNLDNHTVTWTDNTNP